ncbi:U3 snoRNP protein [Mycoblastus sanguinarius]|nr:U3 snoRNP protein [Mycoblastus sanguinarius]
MSSGKQARPKKLVKRGTITTKKHRFESFNQRIAKLNIDPIRRRRRNEAQDDDLTESQSFFRTSLERWRDLNLSENFTSFQREVEPLCNSLSQLLHYKQRVFDILASYIERRDSLSLEPLLDLLSNFAHDLGVRFEDHFSRAVALVASLSTKQSSVEVIEWSFTCIAWLFKYLSRLLVPNLQPLFQIMAPLLGRESQKIYTTRFAAEAVSFLVRKAATVYGKDPKPLNLVVDVIRDDILEVSKLWGKGNQVRLYQHGLMTLLVDSIKGVERKLHSGGTYIYHCLIDRLLVGHDQSTCFEEIVYGVTIALIHHTDASTFQPILDIILEEIKGLEAEPGKSRVAPCARLLFVASTVRNGTRVQDWAPLLDGMLSLLSLCRIPNDQTIAEIYKAAAMILQSSPLDLVLPKFRLAMDTIANDRFAPQFLPFCNYFCDLDRQRFQDLLFQYFSKFIVSNWQNQEAQLHMAVPKLAGCSVRNKLTCPVEWQNHIIRNFEFGMDQEDAIVKCCSCLRVMEIISLSPENHDRIMNMLGRMVDQGLQSSSCSDLETTFRLGAGLRYFIQHSQNLEFWTSERWSLICTKASQCGALPPYFEAVLSFVEASESYGPSVSLDSLVDVLIENLHSPSHTLRELSLQILDLLYLKHHKEHADILVTAMAIESSPLDLQSARSISMQIRKLSSQYQEVSSHEWLWKAIPHFCFGLLTYKFSQVWDDAIVALKQICETKKGEESVTGLAFRWLEERETDFQGDMSSRPTQPQREPLTDFQCSNLIQIEELIYHDSNEITAATEHLRNHFDATHTILEQHVANAPVLALRVLLAVPSISEKRSRYLVPMFLSWAADDLEDVVGPDESAEVSPCLNKAPSLRRFNHEERKSMLDLFGCFHNPKVIYRSPEVSEALKGLLTNGNVEIQRSALKALFTWKTQGLQPYHENLLNLLDDARFRDEISTFVHVDNQDSTIQNDHRPELMPVLLRLLYGKMISGAGTTGGSKGQAVKRKAVLEALSRLDKEFLQEFVDIALGRLRNVRTIEDTRLNEEVLARELISVRKQLGLVYMMKDMLETLGGRLFPFAQKLTDALLYCLVRATRLLSQQKDGMEGAADKSPQTSLLKVVRQTGLQCLNQLFHCCSAESLRSYLPTIFSELLSPRLEKLPIETAQSISGILQLFSTWASSKDTVLFLVDYDAAVIKSIVDCLEVPSAKDEVKLFVLDHTLKRIVELSMPSTSGNSEIDKTVQSQIIARKVLLPNIDNILDRTGSLLRKSPSKELLGSAIQAVSGLAPLVEGSSQVESLLDVCTFLLDQPSHRVSPRSKGELLQIIQHFVPLVNAPLSSNLQDRIFYTVSSLFGYFKDRANRLTLSQVLSVLSKRDEELQDVAKLCVSLNSFSTRKIDEPDFDERLRAFNAINEKMFKKFTSKQWRPILYNMLYYVKDEDELAIRSNASFALRRFVEANEVAENVEDDSSSLVKLVLLPALRNGVSEPSELVRTEYLHVMAHLIRHSPQWQDINDMSVLLVNDDEEASFFGNVLHIQQHRRLRALRRLATEARKGALRSSNVAHFFVPLIEHFVFDKADDESAHNLSAETVLTIGALASSLEWPQFRAMFRRFSGYIQSKPDVEKTVIKLLGVIIDALSQAAEEKETVSKLALEVEMGLSAPSHARSALTKTMPRQEKLTDDLLKNLLPSLVKYLHDKDEATVSLRVPVAVSVVKLLKLLPPDKLRERLPPVLTDVCHILRSRAQESRDLTRKTLVDISTLIGPAYFGFVIKELRSALARGYQLHVLSFTVHSILVATSPIFKLGDSDCCLVVSVIIDDIFGATGQEKDAEEYISKMKEVKSSKSYDSMELIAKTATVENLVHLIRPLQTLLEEKLDLRMVKKIDELLRRIGVGLLRNVAVQDRQVLVFCHEIIREVYKTGGTQSNRTSKEDYRTKRFLINYQGANKTGNRGSTSSYSYKLARFALDVLRSVLHKYDTLQTPSNLSGFIPIIGDAVVQSNEEIQISALRFLTTIIKVPLKAIDDNAAIYVAECVKIVKSSTSTNVELAQAALKLVSAILRERRTIEIRETDLAYLLKRLIPDLEEPDKQGVAFNFLKAIMTRKIVITEVYEVLDVVAVIMVTNQTRGARDMARGAYFQFIMDYPQSKDRFSKQLGFLARNLDYKYQEGRQSVMEAIHLLLNKFGEGLVQEIVGNFFVPLVMVLVNDDSSECREMAGALLKKLFERADVERSQSFLNLLRAWLGQVEQPLLIRVALQMYSLYFDTNGAKGEKEIPFLHSRLGTILKTNLKDPLEADWELLYYTLQTFAKICQIFQANAIASSTAPLWSSIRQTLSFPHAWIKLSAAKLLGTYFADFARTNAHTEKTVLPLRGSHGLWLNQQEILEITRASLGLLRVPAISEDLASQTVRNLVFLGRIMAQTSMAWPQKNQKPQEVIVEAEQSEDEEDSVEEEEVTPGTRPAIGHLISRTSLLLRRGPLSTRGPSLIPLAASLSLLGALTNAIAIESLTPHIPTLLLPLHNLTDPAIPTPFSADQTFTEGYKALVSNAQELMSLLQKKLGTTAYVNVLQGVREGVKGRREERRVKRRIETVAEPERAGRFKKRKGERKRERRKERGGEERGRRRGW